MGNKQKAFQQKDFLSLGPHGFHKIAYTQWGRGHNKKTAVCVHGLTRNGRDFDALASAMAEDYRVVCPDIAGRGQSDWLLHPEDYGYPTYISDMAAMISRLGVPEVDWIGTSMGGLIGMMLAAQPNSPIRRLILNDVGPFIPKASLERIGSYVGGNLQFDDIAGVEAYLREVHAPFGPLTDGQWAHLAENSCRRGEKGGFALHYDPAIGNAFKDVELDDVDLWPVWGQIRCPVLIIRGVRSDLLTAETAERMLTEGPESDLLEIEETGHAPALMDEKQISFIRDWLK